MWEIKEYKEAIIIKLYDWDDVISDLDIDKFYAWLNSWVKFMKINGRIINVSNIKYADPYLIDWIESFILSQSKDIQAKLRVREADKKAKIWRWFDSVQEIENFILSKIQVWS